MQSVIERPPPPLEDLWRGGDSGWIHLFRAAGDIEAQLLTGRLQTAGVDARLVKDRSGSGAWLHGGSDPWAPVDVLVRKVHAQEARIVLAEIALAQPAYVPRDVATPMLRRTILWWTLAIALGAGLSSIALARTADHLDRCGLTTNCRLPASP
jgi:hypothetical protein